MYSVETKRKLAKPLGAVLCATTFTQKGTPQNHQDLHTPHHPKKQKTHPIRSVRIHVAFDPSAHDVLREAPVPSRSVARGRLDNILRVPPAGSGHPHTRYPISSPSEGPLWRSGWPVGHLCGENMYIGLSACDDLPGCCCWFDCRTGKTRDVPHEAAIPGLDLYTRL